MLKDYNLSYKSVFPAGTVWLSFQWPLWVGLIAAWAGLTALWGLGIAAALMVLVL